MGVFKHITLTEGDVINIHEVEKKFQSKGIILVYDLGEIIGSVIFYDDKYLLGLQDITDEYTSLKVLMSDYSNFTFKFKE